MITGRARSASKGESMPFQTYHLIWTTYGTWLPGDDRGWIRDHAPGVQLPDAEREEWARVRMVESEVMLSQNQRALVEQTIRAHCSFRGWALLAVNVRTNHIHLVVTADRTADEVMNQLKAWCSRKLSDATGLTNTVARKAGRKHWFTEGGTKRVIDSESYLENAIHYVNEEQ